MMKLFELNSFYIVTDIKEHQKIKSKLLSCIESMPHDSIDVRSEIVSKTDWNIPSSYKREYLDIFYSVIEPYMEEMAFKLKSTKCEIRNAWYQVYNDNDKHDWHVHPAANYTNVYYLSLPDKSLKTQLYDLVNERIVENIDVQEGQILTFPANVIHRSPTNTKDQKVVISFNSDFCYTTL